MTAMLPGGLWENGERLRDYAFRPVTGELELQLALAPEACESLPAAVTAALSEALAHIGGTPASGERVRALCVQDRQYLTRQLQRHLGSEGFWCHHRCEHCSQLFDFQLHYADLPVTEARGSYPFVEVTLAGDPIRLRLPNGADQERLARRTDRDEASALLSLLRDCSARSLPALQPQHLSAIEAAMDAVAPAIVTELSARCPHCDGQQVVPLDPYAALGASLDDLLQEVHRLAAHYHWSEDQILGLPRWRRQRYLALIDRERGLTG